MKKIGVFNIRGQQIKLQKDKSVFYPMPGGGAEGIGKNLTIRKGERVLDVGTGTGILAILASKLGGKVLAVDILDQAVCLAQKNALLNDVDIDAIKSDLFKNVPLQKFDVIIANVPQEVFSPELVKNYAPEIITGVDGLRGGSEILKEVLKKAPPFMHSTSRLYIAVYSMSEWNKTLAYITDKYRATLLGFYSVEVKSFVYKDINWYLNKPEILMYRSGNRYRAYVFVFELCLKK